VSVRTPSIISPLICYCSNLHIDHHLGELSTFHTLMQHVRVPTVCAAPTSSKPAGASV
jgi:hypothetical protein